MDDPWFIWVKGRGTLRITPRNAKGWASLAVFVAGLIGPVLALPLFGPPHWWSLLVLAAWLAAFLSTALRFAWPRSKVIDLATVRAQADGPAPADDAWFLPKTVGYGSGLPIAWQGWAVLIGYCGVVTALAVTLAARHQALFLGLTALATLVLCVIAARHTRGGWRWRP
jgi:hypothetical protein